MVGDTVCRNQTSVFSELLSRIDSLEEECSSNHQHEEYGWLIFINDVASAQTLGVFQMRHPPKQTDPQVYDYELKANRQNRIY